MRGFIDDRNSLTMNRALYTSQSAFVRGFIDDLAATVHGGLTMNVSIRVRARLHR